MGRLNLEFFLAKRIATARAGRRNNVMVRIATLSVGIGIAVMIVSLAVIFGFKREIASKLSGFGSHVQVVTLYGNNSYETTPISRDQSFLAHTGELRNLAGIHPFATKVSVVRGRDAIQGVVLKGVDSTYDWSFFRANLQEGSIPDVADTIRHKEVLISRSLADLMDVRPGDPIEIMNPPRLSHFRVSGIYDTHFGEMDRMMILSDLRDVQRLNGWDSTQISGYELMTTDFGKLERFTEDVYRLVSDSFTDEQQESLRVVNIRERNPMIFDWLNAHNVNAAVIIVVMLVVAVFNMISALLIILLEKTSMIGVLKALGMGNRALQKMFVIRSSFIILKGMLWGNVAGIGLCLLQYYTGWLSLSQEGYFLTTVPVWLDWGWLVLLNLATFALIVALLALPTLIISLILPEKSIRFE